MTRIAALLHNDRDLRRPLRREPDFGATRVNYDLPDLLSRATEPN